MMKVTREQAAEVLNGMLIGYGMANGIAEIAEFQPITARTISKACRGMWGDVELLPNGTKLLRYKDRNNMPAYCIVGYASDGSDVSKLAALLPST